MKILARTMKGDNHPAGSCSLAIWKKKPLVWCKLIEMKYPSAEKRNYLMSGANGFLEFWPYWRLPSQESRT